MKKEFTVVLILVITFHIGNMVNSHYSEDINYSYQGIFLNWEFCFLKCHFSCLLKLVTIFIPPIIGFPQILTILICFSLFVFENV